MTDPTDITVGVVGAGLMGHGIAQVFGVAGARVKVYDPDPEARDSLIPRITANLDSIEAGGEGTERISPAASLAEAAAGAELVVEAAPEDLDLKRSIFAELDDLTGESTILATNTSVMSVTEIAASSGAKERVVGTHWWNPPYLVPLVEVIQTETTSAETIRRTMAILESVGKHPVHVKRDVPGFVGNRMQHAMWREALSLVDQGVCDPETVDLVVREGFGGRLAALGPIENADLIGLDLTESIHRYILPHLDRSTVPARGLSERVARGDLGAKSGLGYVEWPEGSLNRTRERLNRYLMNTSSRGER